MFVCVGDGVFVFGSQLLNLDFGSQKSKLENFRRSVLSCLCSSADRFLSFSGAIEAEADKPIHMDKCKSQSGTSFGI